MIELRVITNEDVSIRFVEIYFALTLICTSTYEGTFEGTNDKGTNEDIRRYFVRRWPISRVTNEGKTARTCRSILIRRYLILIFLDCFNRFLSIDLFPHIVDFRSAVRLPYQITGKLQIPTRASRQKFWVARVWHLVWMARALDRLLIRCLAPNMEDIITVARIGVDQFASHETTLRLSYAKLRQYGTWLVN